MNFNWNKNQRQPNSCFGELLTATIVNSNFHNTGTPTAKYLFHRKTPVSESHFQL